MLRGRVDPKKEEQDRLQGFLLDMLKEEENKYCADCQAKTPRWAAWNLGIFICIRCAGIHRNLGVHISKVRSVNLDSWTAEQVQTMRVMGNEKARQVYEHDLPAQFRRPTSDVQMEQFIRSKYEQKRYMLRDFSYPKVDVADLTKSLSQFSSKKSVHPVVSISAKSSTQSTNKSGNGTSSSNGITNDLLDFSAPPSSKSAPKTSSTSNFFDDIAGLSIQDNTPKAAPTAINDDFDDFGSFVSATTTAKNTNNSKQAGNFGDFADFSSAPTTAAPSAPVSSNLADLATISEGGSNEQKKSNADILSLFGTTGTTSAAAPIVAPGGFAGFGLQAAPNTILQSSFPAFGSVPLGNQNKNDLYGGLGGVSFGVPNTLSFGKAGSNAPVSNINSLGQQNLFASNKSDAPTSPTGSQGFNIPNKSNAFADLALGKVMKTSYGQSALNPSSTTTTANRTVSPIPSTTSSKPSSNTVSNDLFDMFSNNPPPVPVTVNASSGLDDLLGL